MWRGWARVGASGVGYVTDVAFPYGVGASGVG